MGGRGGGGGREEGGRALESVWERARAVAFRAPPRRRVVPAARRRVVPAARRRVVPRRAQDSGPPPRAGESLMPSPRPRRCHSRQGFLHFAPSQIYIKLVSLSDMYAVPAER